MAVHMQTHLTAVATTISAIVQMTEIRKESQEFLALSLDTPLKGEAIQQDIALRAKELLDRVQDRLDSGLVIVVIVVIVVDADVMQQHLLHREGHVHL